MRSFFYIASFVLSPLVFAGEHNAYLVINSSVLNAEKQPTWICLMRRGICEHIAADKNLIPIKPGKYKLHHIDFSESQHSGAGTQIFKKSMRFHFESDNIYFVGNLELEKKRPKIYDISLKQDPQILISACEASPEIFSKYPVTNLSGSVKKKLSCK